MAAVELVAGMTVWLGVGGPGPCVGTIERVDGPTVEIDLHEGRPPRRPGDDITLFATDDEGLHCWPARVDDETPVATAVPAEGSPPDGGSGPDGRSGPGRAASVTSSGPARVRVAAMGAASIVQRRRHSRVPVDLRGEITVMRQGRRRPRRPVTVTDLSHGGARLSGPVRLEVGDTVMLHIDPGQGTLDLRGRVAMAYDNPAGGRIGHVAFLAPEELTPALRRLDRYLVPKLAGSGGGSPRAASRPRAW